MAIFGLRLIRRWAAEALAARLVYARRMAYLCVMASLDDPTSELALQLQKELPRKRVLIVDRHPAARDSLRMMLSAL